MFNTIGAALQAAGYTVTPCNGKAPVLKGWQQGGAIDCSRHPGANVGLVLGVAPWYFVALDIDTTDELAAECCEAYAVKALGAAPCRVGLAPKRLLLYRLDGPHQKLKRGALEVLATGQQCVVYGRHPSGCAYTWTDWFGGLTEWRPEDIPLVTWAKVEAWMEKCAAVLPAAQGGQNTHETARGEGVERDPLSSYAPPCGLSIDEARELLRYAGDPADYDEWLRVGMALHHEGQGSDDWLELWDGWSADAANYVGAEDLAARWASFGKREGRPVTLKWLVAARSAARGSQAAEGGPYLRTEMGNARRLVDAYKGELRWCADLATWLRFTGVYWRFAHETEVMGLAAGAVEGLWDEARALPESERADAFKWAARSQTRGMCASMVGLAAASSPLWVSARALDAKPFLLGARNGAIDLRTGELKAPSAEDLITRVTACAYERGAAAPWFRRTVLEVFKDNAVMASFFQRVMGYALLANPVEDLLIILYGQGNNGKSTLMNAIYSVLGDHAAMAPASTFLRDGGPGSSNAGGARADILALAGRRVVRVTEPEEHGELREGVIKSMTGGDPMVARQLYSGTMIEIQPTWTAFLATNHRPIIRGDDTGIWRRLLLIPFTRNFKVDGTEDLHREDKLKAEAPGILWWMVEGALAYQREGLAIPLAVEESRREYRGEMDLLADWLGERCVLEPTLKCSLDALWADWEGWAKARGELRFISSRKMLSRKLQNRGCVKEHGMQGLTFWGLNLKEKSISDV